MNGISVHLLAYLHDPAEPELAAEMERTRADRVTRARRMVDLIAVDHPVDLGGGLGRGRARGDGRPPAHRRRDGGQGAVADRDEAFATVLHSGSGTTCGTTRRTRRSRCGWSAAPAACR